MILGKVRYLILVWNIFIFEVESAAEDSDLSGGIKPFRFEPYVSGETCRCSRDGSGARETPE